MWSCGGLSYRPPHAGFFALSWLPNRNLDDLRAFYPASLEWRDLTLLAKGQRPCARSAHGMAALGSMIYVFGGSSNAGGTST